MVGLPWALPLASHPTVTSDAWRDREQAVDTSLRAAGKAVPLIWCDLVSQLSHGV